MQRKRLIWLALILFVLILGIIYGISFQKCYPEYDIDQLTLYGTDNINLKDFVSDDGEVLIAQSADPWVTYSLDKPRPIAYIEIDASNVQDLGGCIHIFDTDSWKEKLGKLRNGRNGYYIFDKSDQWMTQNFRFDLVEVVGATCSINNIVINPAIKIWAIGFLRMILPLYTLLITIYFLQNCVKYGANVHSKNKTKETIRIILGLVISVIVSYSVMLNLRITISITNWCIITMLLYIMFYVTLPNIWERRNKSLVLIFSLLLSMANSLGSHVVVGQTPYTDLMDQSYITPYVWQDVIGIGVMVVVIYRGILIIMQMLASAREMLSKNTIFFTKRISFAVPMLIMLFCWLPYFILYYPGFILGDSVGQIRQAIGVAAFSNHHPVFHTLFIRLCIRIGELYGGLTFGCALYTIFQMLYLSFALSKLIEWLSQHRVPFLFICIIICIYSVIPYFGQTSIAMWKDPAFGASVVLLTINVMDYLNTSDECAIDKKIQVKYLTKVALYALLTCLFRNNGVYALIFTCLILLIVIGIRKNNRKELIKLLANLLVVVCLYLIITGPVYAIFKIAPTERAESVGICINQMASVAASGDGKMTEEERQYMNDLLPIEKYKETYRPCAVDLLKWDPDFNDDYLNSKEFYKIYVSMGLKNPGKYIDAWALMTFGYWAPNRWELNNDSNNLSKGNFNDLLISGLPIKTIDINHLPNNLLYKVFTAQGSIISLGMLDWILLFSVLVMLLNQDWSGLVSISVSVGIMITLVIASPYWYWQRYGLAQYYLFPIYLYFIVLDLKKPAYNINLKEQERK